MLAASSLKVMVVHSRTTSGGLTQIIKGICAGMCSRNVKVALVLLAPQNKPNEDGFFKDLGVEIIYVKGNSFLSKLHDLKKTVAAFAPHIIHTHGFQGVLACQLLRLNIPHVSTLHGNLFLNYQDDFNVVLGKIIAFFQLLLFSKVSYPVLVSASLKSIFLVPAYSNTIFNGVDKRNFFPFSEAEKQAIRAKLNLKPAKFIFISTGQVIARKNTTLLLSAFSQLSQEHSSTELHFLGDGPLLPSLKETYKKLPNVYFHGKQPNVSEWLNVADCFLSASLSEGFPNAPLEAYSCGLPLILSDIGPHREIKERVPEAAMLFSQEEELIQQMKSAVATKHRILNPTAFSQDEMVDEYLNLFLSIANSKQK